MSEQQHDTRRADDRPEAQAPGASSEPQQTELERVWTELLEALRKLESLSLERDRLERRLRESADSTYHLLARGRERDLAIGDLRRELAETRTALARERKLNRERTTQASGLLKQTATGLKAFQAQFDRDLRQYRSQRAWQAMLFLRKAYTHVVRQGWSGRRSFARWLLGLGGAAAGGLGECELQFPDVLSYLPSEVQALYQNGAAADVEGPDMAPALGLTAAQPRPRAGSGLDIVVLPVFEFDFRLQRPQHLAQQLARRGHRVFWVSPSRTLPLSGESLYEAVSLQENLWEIHLRTRQPDIYLGGLSAEDLQAYSSCLQRLYREWTIAASGVLVQLPFWHPVAAALREAFGARMVYDCMDDWADMPGISEFNRSEEAALIRECDVLVVTSHSLRDKCAARGRAALLAPNATDFEFFSAARPSGRLANIPRPVVGYFGAIAQWFDYDLLYEAARSRPNYSFVLIGGFGLEQDPRGGQILRLRELPNVYALGHKPYAELPSYLAEFDVCIIPFTLDQVIQATDPVKLYEYLSQGKPVVTTPMGELSRLADLIYVASGAEDFARTLDTAVAERDEGLKARRIQFAAANTWSERAESLERALAQAFPLVSVVIVTYDSARYVDPCLESLRRNTCYPSWEAIVVDNGSQDGTADLAARHAEADPRIRVIRNLNNAGFAAGNNLAIGEARGEYLVLLNIDTIVTWGWLERLVRHARRDPGVGMVVPVTNWAGNEARIDVPYTNLEEMENFALDLARDNLGIALEIRVGPLFCALIPRPVWEKVGGLDERFEVGMFEDDDYSCRLARAGYRIATAEDCLIHHFGQAAFSQLSPRQYQEIFDANKRRYEEKWGFSWIPHQYRPGLRAEGARFTPEEFVGRSKDVAP